MNLATGETKEEQLDDLNVEFCLPDTDLYGIAHYFLTKGVRRLPVVQDGKLLGQVTRRDVLRLIDQMSRARLSRKHYPDYREPEKLSVPRGSSRGATRSFV